MPNSANQPPHLENATDRKQKKRIPIFILVIVGVFLISIIFYMLADRNPKPGEIPADQSIPAVQDNHAADDKTTAPEATATEAVADTAKAADH